MAYSGLVNAYNFRDGSGTTLLDRVGSANGTLGGASLPTWNAAGFMSFVGGHGAVSGDYNRINFTRTTFDYNYNQPFSHVIFFRTTNTVTLHYLFGNSENSLDAAYMGVLYTKKTYNYIGVSATKTKTAISSLEYNDGKWHVLTMRYDGANTMYSEVDGVTMAVTNTGTINTGSFYAAISKFCLGVQWQNSVSKYIYDYTGDMKSYKNFNILLPVAAVQNEINEHQYLI